MEKDLKDQIEEMDRKILSCNMEIQKIRDGNQSVGVPGSGNMYEGNPRSRYMGGRMGGGMRGGG